MPSPSPSVSDPDSSRSSSPSSPSPGANGGLDSPKPPESIADLPDGWHYESSIARVEAIIEQIETGELELAEIFEQFAIAVQHLQECDTFLNHHRHQVDILVETLTDESPS